MREINQKLAEDLSGKLSSLENFDEKGSVLNKFLRLLHDERTDLRGVSMYRAFVWYLINIENIRGVNSIDSDLKPYLGFIPKFCDYVEKEYLDHQTDYDQLILERYLNWRHWRKIFLNCEELEKIKKFENKSERVLRTIKRYEEIYIANKPYYDAIKPFLG